jgi:hypothetical protein
MPDACPGTPGHCRCEQHDPGLLAYSRDPAALEAALAKLKPATATLRIVTPERQTACTGTMSCPCQRCLTERVTRPAVGEGNAAFRIRPPRHLRAKHLRSAA